MEDIENSVSSRDADQMSLSLSPVTYLICEQMHLREQS